MAEKCNLSFEDIVALDELALQKPDVTLAVNTYKQFFEDFSRTNSEISVELHDKLKTTYERLLDIQNDEKKLNLQTCSNQMKTRANTELNMMHAMANAKAALQELIVTFHLLQQEMK